MSGYNKAYMDEYRKTDKCKATQKRCQALYEKTPKRIAYNRKRARIRNLRVKFQITLERYDAMLEAQKGLCAICARPQSMFKKAFAIDHNHETGKIRELLCNNCNTALGSLRDSVGLLSKAIDYIQRHS